MTNRQTRIVELTLGAPIAAHQAAPFDAKLRDAQSADILRIIDLLALASLATAGVTEASAPDFVVLEGAQGPIVAAGGVVRGQDAALLRSIVVAPAQRGRGLGAQVVDALEAKLRREGTRFVHLLTTSARSFFASHGYTDETRAQIPGALLSASGQADACPASAHAMLKALD